MDEFSTTSDNLGQTDEEILTYAASDEALEAAAGTERGPFDSVLYPFPCFNDPRCR
jgi:histidinol-phosphate/aromatic aminotransferase/cobyric acid decarboxylase-like protein